MTPEQINDLAFKFVEMNLTMTAGNIRKYFYEEGGIPEELDYFLVFVKHWLNNKMDLQWAGVLIDCSYFSRESI